MEQIVRTISFAREVVELGRHRGDRVPERVRGRVRPTARVIKQFARSARPAPPRGVNDLTDRELDVFRLIARGLSNAEIGLELYISEATVKTHMTHILQKLNLRDRVQVVVLAHETGLLDAD